MAVTLEKIPCRGADWESFSDIARASFDRWHAGYASGQRDENYVLKRDGEIVGGATVDPRGNGLAYLHNIAVSPERRGEGIGHELLAKLEESLSGRFNRLALATKIGNAPFYEKAGFKIESSGITHCALSKALS